MAGLLIGLFSSDNAAFSAASYRLAFAVLLAVECIAVLWLLAGLRRFGKPARPPGAP